MELRNIHRKQIYIFITLSILLAVFCTVLLLQAHAGALLKVTWSKDQALPEIHLAAGETIKGWEKDDIVY